jgi:hypothetical protein
MDEFRESWEIERAAMADRMRELTLRLDMVERENRDLRALLGGGVVDTTAASVEAIPGLAGVASVGGAPGVTGASGMVAAAPPSPPPVLFADPPQPPPPPPPPAPHEAPPFVPVSSQSDEPRADFMPSPHDEAPIPIIDVQTLHPELEGIPIRVTAVQRSTFTDGTAAATSSSKPASPTQTSEQSPKRLQTVEALSAEASTRLTMHAGHTPSHSLSMIPSTAASTIADTSQGATPTQLRVAGFELPRAGGRHSPVDAAAMPEMSVVAGAELHDSPARNLAAYEATGTVTPTGIVHDDDDDDDSSSHAAGPSDDVPLKAPLMIRNIPAKDEEFLRLVNAKLEPISRGENVVPTVMEKSPSEVSSVNVEMADQVPHKTTEQPTTVRPRHEDDDDDDDDDVEAGGSGKKKATEEIPLRLKKTSNFGVPFGQI